MSPEKNLPDDWLTAGRFAGLLALFIVLMFPDVVFGGNTFVFRDFGLFGYPLAFHLKESLLAGEFPLLNPLNNCGLPFFAQWNTLGAYPLSLIYLALPLSWSLTLFCLLHQFLGGMGMYWLAKRWSGNSLAAGMAGVAFAFNGFVLSSLMHPNFMAAWAWMPFVVLTVPEAWRQGGKWIVLAVMAGSMQMLAGPPEIVLSTWVPITLLWAGEIWFGTESRSAIAKRMLAVILLISSLSAVQLLPFFDLLLHSHRTEELYTNEWGMPGTGWANFLLPLFGMEPTPQGVFMQLHPQQGLTTSYFAGIGVATLTLTALLVVRSWQIKSLLCLSFFAVFLSMGDEGYLYPLLRNLFPQLGVMRHPIKLIAPLTLLLPLVAACSFALLRKQESHTQRKLVLLVTTLITIIVLGLLSFGLIYPMGGQDGTALTWNAVSRLVLLWGSIGVLCALSAQNEPRRVLLLGAMFVGLTWVDLYSHVPHQNPSTSQSAYTPAKFIEALEPRPTLGESRLMTSLDAKVELRTHMLPDPLKSFLCLRLSQACNVNLLDKVPHIDGFYALFLAEEARLRSLLMQFPPEKMPPLADFMGISQVTSPENPFAFTARKTALPLITAGQQPIFVEPEQIPTRVIQQSWNPKTTVFLEPSAQAALAGITSANTKILSSRWSPHRVEVEVESDKPTLVVFSQAHYHRWRARVGEKEMPIYNANLAFQAVPIGSGRSRVELIYDDPLFRFGALLSFGTLLSLGVFWWRSSARPVQVPPA